MVAIQDQARVTTKAKEHQVPAGLVWTRLREISRKRGSSVLSKQDKTGRVIAIRVADVVHSLYPKLERDELELLASQIRQDLKAGANALCLESHAGRTPVWWIADTYTPPTETVRVINRKADPELTRAEKKLTPHEAGEDRKPGEMEHIIVSKVSHRHAQKILDLLQQHEEPLTDIEISVGLGIPVRMQGGAARPDGAVKTALRDLEKEKQVFHRFETTAERRMRAGKSEGVNPFGRCSNLYSIKRQVPERKTRDLVGYVLEVGDMDPTVGARINAKKREDRNQRVLEVLIELGRPATISQLSKITGITRGRLEDATRDLYEAGLADCSGMTRSGRRWAAIDVPLDTPSPSEEKEKTMTVAQGLNATENGIYQVARALPEFTAAQLAAETGRSSSTCSELVRQHPSLFEFIRTDNRHRVYRAKDAAAKSASSPDSLKKHFDETDRELITQIRKLVAGPDQTDRVTELEMENADLRERLAKARAALTAALGD